MTELDDRFNQMVDTMLMGDHQLSDLLTRDIVEMHNILDAELQSRAVRISGTHSDPEQLQFRWDEWQRQDFNDWQGS